MNKAYKFFIFQFKIKFNLENGKRKTNEFKGKFNGDKKETEKLQYENLMIKIQIVKLNQNRIHKKRIKIRSSKLILLVVCIQKSRLAFQNTINDQFILI